MESNKAALAAADDAARRLTGRLRLPAGFYPVLAAAIAVQLAASAYGIAAQTTVGLAIVLGGLVFFVAVAALLLHAFRRINGVSLDGLTGRVALAAGTLAGLAYPGALAIAIVAAFQSMWWLVAVAAIAGGVVCALGARQWWAAYRRSPAEHTAGPSPRMLAALAIVGALGFVALMVVGS